MAILQVFLQSKNIINAFFDFFQGKIFAVDS